MGLANLGCLVGGDLDIVDISNPAVPKRAGSFPNASNVVVAGENVYAASDDGFSILRTVRTGK